MKNLAGKWPKVDVLAILADDFGHSPRPVGAPSLRAAFRNQSARVIFATGACLSYKKNARTPIRGTAKKICGSRSHHLCKPRRARVRLTATARRCLPGSGHRKLQADGVAAVCQLQARAGFGSIQAHSCAVAAARQLQCVRICHILSCHPQARWVCTRLRHIGARPFTPSPIGQANHSINTVLNVWVSAKADYSSDRRCT